ncbi:Serine--tRNA ligase, mitochondrial [Orbilia oligospora]|uniref:serine--tRNA ligase n=1 Tax=Orbilia oligospora TaxID=2813651 RepID=A0A7C8PWV5_ORBOL|nr:Serine--tRNA ligase, mitochondrial [Orbilia oligospora]
MQPLVCNLSSSLASLQISTAVRAVSRLPTKRLAGPLLSLRHSQNLSKRPFQIASLHTSSPLNAGRKRKPPSNPWAIAKAAEKRGKVTARKEELQKMRQDAASDPVVGHTTPFLEAMDSSPAMLPPIDHLVPATDAHERQEAFEKAIFEERLGRLNHYLQPDEVKISLARSKALEDPPLYAVTEKSVLQGKEMHLKATAAMNRILSLSNGSSKDKTRANKTWCVETFGRHITDEKFPQPKHPSIASNPGTDPIKTPRVGRDTGSSEVQAALLTMKIRTLAQQLETNTHDKMNKRNLRVMVHKRQKLLKYLKRKERGGQRYHMNSTAIISKNPKASRTEADSLNGSKISTLRSMVPINNLQTSKPPASDYKKAQAKVLKRQISTQETVEQQLEDEMNMLAAQLPNLTHPDTPIQGKLNVVEYINKGRLPALSSQTLPKITEKQIPELLYRGAPGISHVEIGTELGILDFSSSSKTSGWGWYFLHGDAVLLEQALIQYSLACARSKGWDLVSPPSIVYTHIAGACGFKPRDNNNEQQIYHISQGSAFEGSQDSSRPELCLAGTAEIPLAGMFANTALPKAKFPKKMVGVSRCYRAEAGSHGLATKGLYRVHEFTKVELFAWTLPDPDLSDQVFKEILDLQRDIITSLEIPARVISMPSDDLGAPAYRKYDIEAFMPSRKGEKYGGWGEVTSVTLAVPRIITAILENNWDDAKREVRIPEVLQPYMGGLELIKNSESAP